MLGKVTMRSTNVLSYTTLQNIGKYLILKA